MVTCKYLADMLTPREMKKCFTTIFRLDRVLILRSRTFFFGDCCKTSGKLSVLIPDCHQMYVIKNMLGEVKYGTTSHLQV